MFWLNCDPGCISEELYHLKCLQRQFRGNGFVLSIWKDHTKIGLIYIIWPYCMGLDTWMTGFLWIEKSVSGLTSLNAKIIYMCIIRIGVEATDWILSTLQGNNPVFLPVEHSNVKVLYRLVRTPLSTRFLKWVFKQWCFFWYLKLTELWARVGKLSLTSITLTLQLQRDDIPSAAPSRSDAFTTRV